MGGLVELFRPAGCEASHVAIGAEIRVFARKLALDAMLPDVNPPDMSGFEVCQRLRRDQKTAKIVVMVVTGSFPPAVRHVTGTLS